MSEKDDLESKLISTVNRNLEGDSSSFMIL